MKLKSGPMCITQLTRLFPLVFYFTNINNCFLNLNRFVFTLAAMEYLLFNNCFNNIEHVQPTEDVIDAE